MKVILVTFLVISQLIAINCDEIEDEINTFIRERKKERNELTYEIYIDVKNQYFDFIDLMRNNCTDKIEYRKLLLKHYYHFSIWTSKKQGDIELYKTTFIKLKSLIDSLYSDLKSTGQVIDKQINDLRVEMADSSEIKKLEIERKDINDYLKNIQNKKIIIIDSLDVLNNKYSDVVIFVKDTILYNMTEISHNQNNNLIPIEIEAPLSVYENQSFKQRLEFLKNSKLGLSFTKYNNKAGDKGFFAIIPQVPIIDRSVKKNISNTYAITVGVGLSDLKRYRLEFNERHKDTLFVDFHNDWKTELKIPNEWTRFVIPKKLTWEYVDVDKNILAEFSEKELKYHEEYGSEFIAIDDSMNHEIIIYHKLNEKQANQYRLNITTEENNKLMKWIRNSLVLGIAILIFQSGELDFN